MISKKKPLGYEFIKDAVALQRFERLIFEVETGL